jgi:hypothetical protein
MTLNNQELQYYSDGFYLFGQHLALPFENPTYIQMFDTTAVTGNEWL